MKRDSITIVFVSETREPITVEISLKGLMLIAFALLILLTASCYSLYSLRILKAQRAQLEATNRELKVQSQAQESRLSKLEAELEAQKGSILLISELGDTSALNRPYATGQVVAEDLKTRLESDTLIVDFRLVNTRNDAKLLSGYLLVVAEHESGDLSRYGTFPDFKLVPQQPINYSQGDTYAIRNFKPVRAAVPLKDIPEAYKTIKLLVFSENGGILLYESRKLNW